MLGVVVHRDLRITRLTVIPYRPPNPTTLSKFDHPGSYGLAMALYLPAIRATGAAGDVLTQRCRSPRRDFLSICSAFKPVAGHFTTH